MTLAFFAVFVAAGLATWFLLQWGLRGLQAYRLQFREVADQRLSEFFLYLDASQLWRATCLFAGASGGVIALLTGYWWAGMVLASVIVAAPQFVLSCLRRRRLARIDDQLPEFLMALSGALRSGASLQSALRQVGQRQPAPLGQEILLMLREQRLGMSFRESLESLQRRVQSEGIELMVSALGIASQSGGSLGPMLEDISTTLRLRQQLLGRIRALTSQGRLQAWVMAALPPLLGVVLAWLDPDSMRQLWETPVGWAVMLCVLVLEVCGIWFIRRIVSIQV